MAALVALLLIVAAFLGVLVTARRRANHAVGGPSMTTSARQRGCPRCGNNMDAAARSGPTSGHTL
jgi:hypothetical protein